MTALATLSHIPPPVLHTASVHTTPRSRGPARPTQHCMQCVPPPVRWGTRRDWATSKEMSALWHFFLEANFVFLCLKSLFSSVCMTHFGGCKQATAAMLIVLFTYSQGYSHYSALWMFYRAKHSTEISCFWALSFHMKNEFLRSRAALHWGSILQTEAKPCSFSLPWSGGFLLIYPCLLHTGGCYELHMDS